MNQRISGSFMNAAARCSAAVGTSTGCSARTRGTPADPLCELTFGCATAPPLWTVHWYGPAYAVKCQSESRQAGRTGSTMATSVPVIVIDKQATTIRLTPPDRPQIIAPMGTTVRNISFDTADAYAVATFWSQVLGHPLNDDDHPGDPVAVIQIPGGPTFYFENVPEPKVVKNRVHVCLAPDLPRDEEVERVLGLGATVLADRREPDGTGWVVFADP